MLAFLRVRVLFAVVPLLVVGCSQRIDLLPPPIDAGPQEAAPDAGPQIGLSISAGTLVPTFDPKVTTYQVLPDVRSLGAAFTVTATAPSHTITIAGKPATSGVASDPIALGTESPTTVNVDLSASSGDLHYVLTVPPQQEAYIKPSNTAVTVDGPRFGRSIAMDGNTLVVGAPNESSGGKGIDGNQNGLPSAPGSGAVYIFTRVGTAWKQQAYVKALQPHAGDAFGRSVALVGDTLVVGAPEEASKASGINGDPTDVSAPGAGAAYVFTRAGSTWSQQAYLKPSNTRAGANFGKAVAIDADTVIVGSELETSKAIGVNGDPSDTSMSGAGATYVFVRTGSTWMQQAYLKPTNTAPGMLFGFSVAISQDTIVVGASNEQSNATGVNGNASDTSLSAAGAAYVFFRSSGAWTQQAYLKPSNTRSAAFFGYSVAVRKDTVAVGALRESSAASGIDGNANDTTAPSAGAVYVFTRTGSNWAQQAYVKPSNTLTDLVFGTSVSLGDDLLAVGAAHESSKGVGVNGLQNDTSKTYAGATYLFARNGAKWSQQAYLKASNTAPDAQVGSSVAISGDSIAIGAAREASKTSGVNGDQLDTSIAGAGAVYVLR